MAVGAQAVYTDFYRLWIACDFCGRMPCHGTGYGAVDRFFTELYEETPENLVYTVEVNRRVKVDDMVVGVEELRYYENGDMELKYITYQELFSTALTGTFDFYDCYLTDGENYTSQFRPRDTQIEVSGIYYEAGSITYPDFPADAKECHFIYDREGRQFDMEIPCSKGGRPMKRKKQILLYLLLMAICVGGYMKFI